ncbi:hypothetical protein JXA80_04260, partial [bacterium]|nr:hypothetical protein [candidate division CSSED10-310 bacterium]
MKHSRYTGINNNQAGLPFSAAVSGHRFGHCLILVLFFALMLSASPIRGQEDSLLCATSVYQGLEASDAFTAMHYLGSGRIIAGKRSSQAATRFLLSSDYGLTWDVVGCPSSTGAHTYFFGQNGPLVFSGTGDTGNACLMKSTDTGVTWSVALTSGQIRSLLGTANALAVFGPVYLGSNRWMVNV